MKKYLFLFISIVCFSACSDDIEDNTPAFEGVLENDFWRASNVTATTAGGGLIIQGVTAAEVLTIKTSSTEPGAYTLGTGTANVGKYALNNGGNYTTGDGVGDGQIVITSFANGQISGTFRFNAALNGEADGALINMQRGVFFKVPVGTAAAVE